LKWEDVSGKSTAKINIEYCISPTLLSMRVRDIGDIKEKVRPAKLEELPAGGMRSSCGKRQKPAVLAKERRYPSVQVIKRKGNK
jgi:hypothetical protein